MTLPASDFSDPFVSIYHGDSWALAPMLDPQSINCIVTSPPYWGLRDYGEPGQFGLEKTPEEYVARLVDLFQLLRPALRDDGTVWLNLGDSYASGGTGGASDKSGLCSGRGANPKLATCGHGTARPLAPGLKPKDLVGIPWRVAFALQADGWYLRQDIIWHKPNPMPESVTDRCTKAHEYMFLLSKRPRYYYDARAIAEPAAYPGDNRAERTDTRKAVDPMCMDGGSRARTGMPTGGTRNRRSVWTVATQPFSAAHFATFPPELIRPCILAGCPERTCPKCGAAWERIVEKTKTFQSGSGRSGNEIAGKQDLSASDTNSTPDIRKGPCVESHTVGFAPICTCDCADTIPGIVLDPFMGSGTTAAVARKLGRRSVGFELNAEYIEIAAEHRLSEGMLL